MEKEALQLMFTRPTEPLFMPKDGESTPLMFDMPEYFYNDRYTDMVDDLKTQFKTDNANVIEVQNIDIPDLSIPMKLKRNENFTLFLPSHKEMATKLIDIFMQQRTVKDLISLAAYCRDRINPYLFNYALSVTLLHREDTRDISLPNFLEVFPGKFVDSNIFSKARREVSVVPAAKREPIILAHDFTANEKEPEQKIAYFREDLGINLHHWHWHLVYPTDAADRSIVDKDRRGELFYYMHEQVLARYNAERFANDLGYCKPYTSFRDPIAEGYFPKLEMMVASRPWPPRFVRTTPRDINRMQDQFEFNISMMESWQKSVVEAIEKGYALDPEGKQVSLMEENGIDILGNMLEASILTPNPNLYGAVHNIGHVLIALCHDPDGRFLESFAVLGDTATAMRDPIFYRWHTYINNLCTSLKIKRPYYDTHYLSFEHVSVTDIQIHTKGKRANEFHTFWQQTDMDMSRGIDFSPREGVKVRFTHLQHTDFTYNVKVKNASTKQLLGYMRIFMAPHLNDKGEKMNFEEQRRLMIELDKFKVTLNKGINTITHKSLDSSVTIPYERTFRSIDAGRPTDETSLRSFNFCGCGWPQHMLIPRGTERGMLFDLFVMVSDYSQDKIDQDISGICNDADSYCGIQDKKYPDTKSMGYPFDRIGRPGADDIYKFMTPNMKTRQVKVIFTDRTEVVAETKQALTPGVSLPAQDPATAGHPPEAPAVVPAKPAH